MDLMTSKKYINIQYKIMIKAIQKVLKDVQESLMDVYKVMMKNKIMSVLIIISILLLTCMSNTESFVIYQSLPSLHTVSEESYGFVCDVEDKDCQFPIPVMKIVVEDKRGMQYMKFKMVDEEGVPYYTKMYQLGDEMLKLGAYLYFDNGKVMLIVELQ